MAFSKRFPKTVKGSSYPVWEEVSLSDEEEKAVEELARNENKRMIMECIRDAKQMLGDRADITSYAVALFEKRASHIVYWKERKCKEKFDSTS